MPSVPLNDDQECPWPTTPCPYATPAVNSPLQQRDRAGGAVIGAVGVDVVGPTAPMSIGASFCGLGVAVALSTRVGSHRRDVEPS